MNGTVLGVVDRYAELQLEGATRCGAQPSPDRPQGAQALLAAMPPDKPFEWPGVPNDIHPRVREVLDLCDRCAEELLDIEHRTAQRRLLSRVAVGGPAIFRRKGVPERAAAAVAWVITKANESAGYWQGGLEVQELLPGSASIARSRNAPRSS